MDPGMECEDYEIDFNINVGYFIIDIFYLSKAKSQLKDLNNSKYFELLKK
jgi:hypothetical protein